MSQTRRILNATQVAELLGKSLITVQRMARNGEIPGTTKLPGTTGAYVFDAEAVETLARELTEAKPA